MEALGQTEAHIVQVIGNDVLHDPQRSESSASLWMALL